MNKTVIGFFDDKSQADEARRELELAGISTSNINVLSNSSESATTGATSGMQNESFMDRVKNFFRNLGDWNVPEEHTHYYAEGLRRGGYVVSVVGEDMEIERAADILDRCGAVDIDRRGEYYKASGFSGYDMNSAPYSADQSMKYKNDYMNWEKNKYGADTTEERIPVVEEKVSVGKRAIDKGRVRIFTRIRETPIEEQVQLRDEHIEVQRRPADRPVNAADMEAFKEGELEFKETAEEAVVDKQARVVEEVIVSKQANERTETIRDTARRTDVEIDRGGMKDKNLASDRDMSLESDDLLDRNASDRRLKDDLTKPSGRV